MDFPITYQINWELTSHSAQDAQAVADDVRGLLHSSGKQLGAEKELPRLFYQK
jgi:hypothetical protein